MGRLALLRAELRIAGWCLRYLVNELHNRLVPLARPRHGSK